MSVTESAVDGRYQVIARIASGGMGQVYRAQDGVLGREVALKVLHPQYAGDRGFVDRFRREARAAAVLNHPNIVGVYDWGQTDGTYFMVMEYVRGTNLRALLLRRGRLEPAQVVEVAQQVLAALEHAHGHGIVHRDVKPENILIAADGTVKVADFGLARAFADARVSQAEGTVTGTVQYLAPEQIEGRPADPRTDLYALGIVLFELLTGEPPYQGETSMAVAYQHLTARVPEPSSRVPTLEPALDAAVRHATEPRREDRPASARALATEIRRAGAALPPAPPVAGLAAEVPPSEIVPRDRAPTVTIPLAVSPWARRRRLLARWASMVAVLAVIAAASWAVWTYAVPHYSTVPDVRGLSVAAATARLDRAGVDVVIGEGEFSPHVESGLVMRTEPSAGKRVRTGSPVRIVPSRGPELVGVPGVTGRTRQRATALLAGAGFRVRVEEAFHDRVERGRVVSQSPSAGTKLERGSFVTIVVSRGPELVEVPAVAGQPVDVATGTLQSLGLEVATVEEYSVDVARGEVVRTEPGPGARAPKGATVTVVVSLGPRTFPMPDVVGMSADAGRARLESLGLRVKEVQVPGSIGNTIVGQSPDEGTTVEQGERVTIYVGG